MEIKLSKPILAGLCCYLALTLLLSCQKNSNTISTYARPVVEAYLVPGKKIELKLYYQKYLDDTIAYGYPVTGRKVLISDGTSTVQLTEQKPGSYSWGDSTFVKYQKSYSMKFEYNGTEVSASTAVPDKPSGFKASDTLQNVPGFSIGSTPPKFVPVTFSWDNSKNWSYIMVFKNIDPFPSPLNSGDTTKYKDSEVSLGRVSSYQTQQRTFSYLGNYKILLFHINTEYSDALNSSGASSLNLTNPLTNIKNGLGIFTALSADTLNLRVYQK